ncbi:properdin-like [Haliotis cracherodii]|uniref:properdin-like n=1 Tax=Haliotis cracherodii TaxID=6455 RepID=UPI0039ECFF8B
MDGAFGEWSSWSGECSTTCGLNVRYVRRRNRTCDSPKPQNGGLDCQGSHSEEKISPCNIPPCPEDIIHGTYGEWGPWAADQCLLTCGVKVQTVERRNRSCDSPEPQNGGLPCQGPYIEARQIDCEGVAPCPDDIVDGGYGEWSQWTGATCTKTCGVGVTVNIWRNRSCDSPAPQNGGLPCNGTNYESTSMECNIPPCPGNGADRYSTLY